MEVIKGQTRDLGGRQMSRTGIAEEGEGQGEVC